MGLFVDTTGSNVTISELGITLTHPTTNYDLSGQFTPEEIRGATSLTNFITAGTLVWKKTSGGGTEPPGEYDPDIVDIDNENLGPGKQEDRTVTFKDLTAGKIDIQEDDSTVVADADTLNFEGALVTVTDNGSGKATVAVGANTGAILAALFASTANSVNNKFLDTDNIDASDSLPGVMSITAAITRITFSNKNTTPSGTIEIRQNTSVGAPAISVNLGGTQTEVFVVNLAVTAGDRINCKVINGSGVQKPLVKVYL